MLTITRPKFEADTYDKPLLRMVDFITAQKSAHALENWYWQPTSATRMTQGVVVTMHEIKEKNLDRADPMPVYVMKSDRTGTAIVIAIFSDDTVAIGRELDFDRFQMLPAALHLTAKFKRYCGMDLHVKSRRVDSTARTLTLANGKNTSKTAVPIDAEDNREELEKYYRDEYQSELFREAHQWLAQLDELPIPFASAVRPGDDGYIPLGTVEQAGLPEGTRIRCASPAFMGTYSKCDDESDELSELCADICRWLSLKTGFQIDLSVTCGRLSQGTKREPARVKCGNLIKDRSHLLTKLAEEIINNEFSIPLKDFVGQERLRSGADTMDVVQPHRAANCFATPQLCQALDPHHLMELYVRFNPYLEGKDIDLLAA